MQVGDSILTEKTMTKKFCICMHVNQSSYINSHIKLYECVLVKNNDFANEDNDHEGKQSKTNKQIKKSSTPYNPNVYNIIPFVRDFLGGSVVTNLPYNVWDVSSISGRGTKTSCATGQLSQCTTTTEPMHSRGCMPQLESTHAAAREVHNESKLAHLSGDLAQPKLKIHLQSMGWQRARHDLGTK